MLTTEEIANRITGTLSGTNVDPDLIDILAPTVLTWHNFDVDPPVGVEAAIVAPHIQNSGASMRARVADFSVDDIAVHLADDAAILTQVTSGTLPDGKRFRIPQCFVSHIEAGRVTRIDLYADKTQMDALITVLTAEAA